MKPTRLLPLFLLLTTLAGAQETHTVQSNQTLYSIARLYNISVDQLRQWNNLGTEAIRVGQSLVVKPGKDAPANPGLGPFLYTVRTGDSLTSLSVKFGTPIDVLRQINSLGSDQGLYVGQRLYIRRPVGVTFYTVQNGDTLGHVAALFSLPGQDLRAINQLVSDTLAPGRILRVFKPAEVPLNHTVASTDSPAGVAALYGLSVAELQRLNGAEALNLKVGQVLKLRAYASASQGILTDAAQQTANLPAAASDRMVSFPDEGTDGQTYVVQKGDSLLKITRTFGVRLEDLLARNGLGADSVLHVGQILVVGPSELPKAKTTVSFPTDTPEALPLRTAANLPAFRDEDQAKIRWDSYVVLDKAIPVFEWNNDYYYWTHPGELSQPNRGYYENNWPSPLDAYKKARQLLGQFDKLIAKQAPLSGLLKGTTVVLDPGHGGLDPGAIVKASDDNGKEVFLTEHEYVYDISLRVYALLKRHGANVVLTILAPSHLVRDTQPANNTLVNEKNQVYNDLALNQSNDEESWPNGTQKGLEKRIAIADKAFRGVAAGNRVFLSIHADSNPASPYGTGVYALETKEGTIDQKSLAFAQKLLPYLGTDAYARTQNLAVLRGNDADCKVLIEVHNLASDEQSQAMRAGSSRQLSAQKIVRGLLETMGK
jgi:LysM repeat protein/N-acetylmuramoyl-L-alanine amidase